MISNSRNFDWRLHYFEITLENLCQKFTFFVRIKPIWQLFQSPAYYDMTDTQRYGICERAKITKYLVENRPTTLWSIFRILVWWQFLRLYCSDMTFKHTNGLLRCQGLQEKWKRPTKVMKAKQRPESQQCLNFMIFSYQLYHLVSFIDRFECFWVSRPLRPKRPQ